MREIIQYGEILFNKGRNNIKSKNNEITINDLVYIDQLQNKYDELFCKWSYADSYQQLILNRLVCNYGYIKNFLILFIYIANLYKVLNIMSEQGFRFMPYNYTASVESMGEEKYKLLLHEKQKRIRIDLAKVYEHIKIGDARTKYCKGNDSRQHYQDAFNLLDELADDIRQYSKSEQDFLEFQKICFKIGQKLFQEGNIKDGKRAYKLAGKQEPQITIIVNGQEKFPLLTREQVYEEKEFFNARQNKLNSSNRKKIKEIGEQKGKTFAEIEDEYYLLVDKLLSEQEEEEKKSK